MRIPDSGGEFDPYWSNCLAEKREKNKGERRKKILRAAFKMFAENGFDETTTREIAKRAGVAVGTIFLYAQDKVDLLLLSINDELDHLTDSVLETIDANLPLVEQISQFFRPRYVVWSRHPKLSRAAAREMATIYSPDEPSKERARGLARRAHTVERLRDILRRSAKKGELRPDLDIDAAAQILYDIFLIELRFWLASETPKVDEGIEKYRYLVGLILSGLAGGHLVERSTLSLVASSQ